MRYVILFIGFLFAILAMGCIAPSGSPGITPTPQIVYATVTTPVPVPASTLRTPMSLPTPQITQLTGNGNDVQKLTTTGYGIRIFTMTNSGNSNFIVGLKDDKGNLIYLLADEIGPWGGSTSKSLDPGTYYIDVKAHGSWTIDIQSP
jgi:hypothetical protein